jgi:hypothetical protein
LCGACHRDRLEDFAHTAHQGGRLAVLIVTSRLATRGRPWSVLTKPLAAAWLPVTALRLSHPRLALAATDRPSTSRCCTPI